MLLQVYKGKGLILDNVCNYSPVRGFNKGSKRSFFLINDKRCQRVSLDKHAIILYPVLSHSFKIQDTQSVRNTSCQALIPH